MRRLLPDRSFLFAILSGLLVALSFPRPGIAFLAWFGLIPLLTVMSHRPFRSGFIAGLTFFAVALYWLNIVMVNYGHMHPLLSGVAWLLLSAYLALFWATATWASCRIREFKGYPVSMTLPVIWVGLEFLREFLLTGFPWAAIGYSQHDILPLIQSADLFGVYGVTCLLILCNAVLAEICQAVHRRAWSSLPVRSLLFLVLLLALNLGYGWWRLGQSPDDREESLNVALIQGNIEQGVKWLPEYQETTIDIYRELSLQADRVASADLIVWPESATPFYFQEGGELSRRVKALPRETDAYLLFGSPAYRIEPSGPRYLNSAFLLSPESAMLGRSDKIHLVPFGEYVPLGQFLPFIDKIVVGIGDFSAGEVNPLPMNGHQLGVLVCYEAIFPELARDYVRQGSDLLVNITNDAWFGKSSAPWQHLSMVRFRAIENRVWVVRAANTGISAFISPSGVVFQPTGLFEQARVVSSVGVGSGQSLYTRTGDALPALFLLIAIVWLVQTRRRLL